MATSTKGGLNLHYAMCITPTGGTLTSDYNNYHVSGTGACYTPHLPDPASLFFTMRDGQIK